MKKRLNLYIEENLISTARNNGSNLSAFLECELREYAQNLCIYTHKNTEKYNLKKSQNNTIQQKEGTRWARRDLNSSYYHPKVEGCQATPRAQYF